MIHKLFDKLAEHSVLLFYLFALFAAYCLKEVISYSTAPWLLKCVPIAFMIISGTIVTYSLINKSDKKYKIEISEGPYDGYISKDLEEIRKFTGALDEDNIKTAVKFYCNHLKCQKNKSYK